MCIVPLVVFTRVARETRKAGFSQLPRIRKKLPVAVSADRSNDI